MKAHFPRIFLLALLLALLLGAGAFLVRAQVGAPPIPAGQSQEQSIYFEALPAARPNQPDVFLIRLRQDPLASYGGEIPGLEATNPRSRGENQLDARSAASQAYRDYLLARQAEYLQKLEEKLGRTVAVKFQYYAATNGLAVYLTAEEAEQARQLPETDFVQPNYMRYLDTDVSPQWIGATGLWDGSTTGGLPGTKGEGVIVGVIDSGINPSNPSFADVGGDGYNHTNP